MNSDMERLQHLPGTEANVAKSPTYSKYKLSTEGPMGWLGYRNVMGGIAGNLAERLTTWM